MKTRRDLKFVRSTIAALTVGAMLMFVAVPRSQADDRAKCQHRIEKSEAKLDNAIHRHGAGSRQAETARRELNDEREHCWTRYHAWWDAHAHQWHNEHDWDKDHDHDDHNR